MFKGRSLLMFVVALAIGGGAWWMAKRWIDSRDVVQVQPKSAPVVVAALEIPFGQKIERAHLKTVGWPEESVPPGAFSEAAKVEGKIANGRIFPGEAIVEGRVAEHLAGSTMSALISPSMRAVTVRVNDVIGVGGFLLPGNRVDVIASRKSDGRRGRSVTRTILQDLKVLAVDQTASEDKNQPVVVRAVTLEMDPRQAELLVAATDEGTVQLVLRNPTDTSRVVVAEKPKKPAPTAPPAPVVYTPPVITVIRGTQVEETSVKL